MATTSDELILVSVDDHIAEPADMFDGHVPEKYREHAPRVVDEPDGAQQWYYGDIRGRNLGLNAVAGKPPEMFNVNPNRYEDMRPGLLPSSTSACATCRRAASSRGSTSRTGPASPARC